MKIVIYFHSKISFSYRYEDEKARVEEIAMKAMMIADKTLGLHKLHVSEELT